jgi:hypothetical protein
MTDKPKLKDLINLSWDELKIKLCAEIQTALGNKGPWQHKTYSTCEYDRTPCVFCGQEEHEWTDGCLVPPPITDPPEVVARKLRDIAVSKGRQKLHKTIYCLDTPTCVTMKHGDMEIWWFDAEPVEQILACLLALDGR